LGLNIFQVSVFIFYILVSKINNGTPPILDVGDYVYSNPLPHVLILTAIDCKYCNNKSSASSSNDDKEKTQYCE